jgi:hypothetical protein
MSCQTILNQLPLMLYGELSFDEEELVQQHLDGCASCRTELERERKMHQAIDCAEPETPAQLLSDCRRALRVEVAALAEHGIAPKRSAWAFLHNLLPSNSNLWKPAAAVALVAVGFFCGRISPDNGRLTAMREPEPMASRVRYVQPEGSDRVQIVVEEVRQRVLEGGVNDGRIRGLLVAAAREARDPGVRVETMDLLKNQSDTTDVRRALLAALQHDSNPGVRLKAIEALRISAADDSETRRVLANVLLKDDNPGVRTQAIDLLVRKREPALVGVLQELMSREENNYVRLKCQRALSEMNASVETF